MRARSSLPPPAERKALRLALSLSLQDVADAVGVTHEAVRLWELGARKVSRRHLIAYAEVLDRMRFHREAVNFRRDSERRIRL
jgi:transcriptional regulator with XRE-family HTH domain